VKSRKKVQVKGAKGIKGLFDLPIDLKKMNKLFKGVVKEGTQPLKLQIWMDETFPPELEELAKQVFMPQGPQLELLVGRYYQTLPHGLGQADLHVILMAASPKTLTLFHILDALGQDVVLISERSDFDALGRWIVRNQRKKALSWARCLLIAREALRDELVQSTAITNGLIAIVPFLPGADLPVLMISQMQMFLKLAVAYGLDPKMKHLKELAVILASSLGMRGVARRLVAAMPPVSWAVRGTVGYVGTLAIGKLTVLYLESLAAKETDEDKN